MNNLNLQDVGDNPINNPPLKPKSGRAMTLPVTRQGFVVKPFDRSQTLRTRQPGNVFPLLVTLQNLDGNRATKLLVNAAVLFDLPHTKLCICHERYVNGGGVLRVESCCLWRVVCGNAVTQIPCRLGP